jgi:hypothetical protein
MTTATMLVDLDAPAIASPENRVRKGMMMPPTMPISRAANRSALTSRGIRARCEPIRCSQASSPDYYLDPIKLLHETPIFIGLCDVSATQTATRGHTMRASRSTVA